MTELSSFLASLAVLVRAVGLGAVLKKDSCSEWTDSLMLRMEDVGVLGILGRAAPAAKWRKPHVKKGSRDTGRIVESYQVCDVL